jgi:ribosome maturation factor RimP
MMDTEVLRAHIEAIAQVACHAHHVDLWGVVCGVAGRKLLVRIYIDAPHGVTIDHCEAVSKHISVALDVEDLIPSPYTLEVSSPGLDRLFFHLHQLHGYEGATLRVRLREAMEGRRNFQGILQGIGEDAIHLNLGNTTVSLPWENCAKVQLVYDFSVSTPSSPSGEPI